MTTRKLSELPEASHPFLGTEVLPLVQDGETRQVALADVLGEAAVPTWLAPYRVSAQAQPSDNRAALNQAILDAVAQTRPPVLLLPPGRIPVDGPVILRRGIRVNGASAADLPIGTELFLVDGSNSVVLQNETWPNGERGWECAELAYLRVNGNRAGNPDGGSGIAIHGMGKAAEIRSLVVRNCARFGLEFTGPHEPLALRSCTVEDNGLGGLRLAGDGPAVIQGLTGRGQGPLLVVDSGGSPSIVLLGASAVSHRTLFHVLQGNPRLTIIGGQVTASADGAQVVRIEKGNTCVQFIGLYHPGFARLVEDGNGGDGLLADGADSGVAVYNGRMRAADGTGIAVALGTPPEIRKEPAILAGSGSPADDLDLPSGSVYLRRDGGEGSTFYVREGGRWVSK
jgi:hypothetical protein